MDFSFQVTMNDSETYTKEPLSYVGPTNLHLSPKLTCHTQSLTSQTLIGYEAPAQRGVV